jgi:hypothetical protein
MVDLVAAAAGVLVCVSCVRSSHVFTRVGKFENAIGGGRESYATV